MREVVYGIWQKRSFQLSLNGNSICINVKKVTIHIVSFQNQSCFIKMSKKEETKNERKENDCDNRSIFHRKWFVDCRR